MNGKQQFHSLTALKGIFILIIAVHNTLSITPLFDSIPGSSFVVLFGGALGNSMFFMLSGFLLTYSYRERISERTISLEQFLLKRLIRLYPVYLISNFIALIIDISRYGMSAVNLQKIVFTILLQAGGALGNFNPYNSPTWFLSTLFVCYLAFFFVSRHAKSPTQYYCALTIGIIWGYVLTHTDLAIPFCYPSTGLGYMNFFIGCSLSELYPLIRQQWHKWFQPLCLFILAVCGYLFLRYGVSTICGDSDVSFAFLICPLIIYLARSEGLCSKLLQLKPFVTLGKYSPSFFFWHLVVYYGFYDIYQFLFPGHVFQEPQYLLYFFVMIVWSIVFQKYMDRRFGQHK